MSLNAYVWVNTLAPIPPTAAATRVLFALADHADDNGRDVFPSKARIAKITGYKSDTIKKALRTLRDGGWIIPDPGNKKLRDSVGRADQRPNAYVLNFSLRREEHEGDHSPRGPQSPRGTTVPNEGDHSPERGGPQSPQINHDSSTTQPDINTRKPDDYPEAFETWWQHYPRKAAKRKALSAWKRAIQRTSIDVLLEATTRFAEHHSHTPADKKHFIPHPATWLNGDCWDDDLPEQSQYTSTAHHSDLDILADCLNTPPAEAAAIFYGHALDDNVIDGELVEQRQIG